MSTATIGLCQLLNTPIFSGRLREYMGNIRPTYIKRVAIDLVKKFPDKFTADFQQNKIMVSQLTDITNIKMRNRVAGYVTRFRKKYEA